MTQTIKEYVQEQEELLLKKFLVPHNHKHNKHHECQTGQEVLQIGGEKNYRDSFAPFIPCWCHIPSDLQAKNTQLPFADESWQHILLIHQLDHHQQPLLLIKEVLRVLKPQGKLTIIGLNPYSIWRFYHQYYFLSGLFSVYRLRIWLKLIGCDSQTGGFAMYRLPIQRWLSHTKVLEKVGARWFPSFGGLYLMTFVKKEKGNHNSNNNNVNPLLSSLNLPVRLNLNLSQLQKHANGSEIPKSSQSSQHLKLPK
jgi:SAM-dependent methyltransferase